MALHKSERHTQDNTARTAVCYSLTTTYISCRQWTWSSIRVCTVAELQ